MNTKAQPGWLPRILVIIIGLAIVAAGLAVLPTTAHADPADPYQVDAVNHVDGATNARHPALSTDGRRVAYEAKVPASGGGGGSTPPNSTNPPPPGGTGKTNIVVAQTDDNTAKLISGSLADRSVPANGESTSPSISPDGNMIAFVSDSTNLLAGPPSGHSEVYLADNSFEDVGITRVALPGDLGGTVVGVSSPSLAVAGGGNNVVAFVATISTANGVVPHLLVSDLAGTVRGVGAFGAQDELDAVRLSADASTLVYGVTAHDPAHPGSIVGQSVTVYDLKANQQLATFDASPNTGSFSVSSDGTTVAYTTTVMDPQVGARSRAALWQRRAPSAPPIILQPVAASAFAQTLLPTVSADGTRVAFGSTDAYEFNAEIYVMTVQTGIVTRVSPRPSGPDVPEHQIDPQIVSISGDGRVVAFDSDSATLGDGTWDVYVGASAAPPGGGSAPTWPTGANATAAVGGTGSVTLSWPTAFDDVGVTGYVVSVDGAPYRTVDGTTFSLAITGLSAATRHGFTVRAADGSGNVSEALAANATTFTTLTTTVQRVGSSAVLNWDAVHDPEVTGYQLWTADIQDGPFHPLADVPIGATTYTDHGLTIGKTHYYRLFFRHADGSIVTGSAVANAYLPSIYLGNLTFDAPGALGGSDAAYGSTLTFQFDGEPGLAGSATLTGTLTATGAQTTFDVPMTEVSPRTYRGTLTLDGTISHFATAQGKIRDGTNVATTVVRSMDLEVSALLSFTVGSSAAELPGLSLVLDYPPSHVHDVRPVTAPGHYDIPVDANDVWHASLVTADGDVVADAPGLAVQTATVRSVALDPVRHTTLAVTVAPPPGVTTGGVTVTLTAVDRTILGSKTLAVGVGTVEFTGLTAPQTVTVATTLNDLTRPVQRSSSTTAALQSGRNTVTVTEQPLPTGSVSGTVTQDGKAVGAGVGIRVTQTGDGRPWSFDATTGPDGRYIVKALAGAATLAVTNPPPGYRAAIASVSVLDGATTTADLILKSIQPTLIHARLYTSDFGSPESLQTLDWTTNIHFHVSLRDSTGQSLSVSNDLVTTLPGGAISLTLCADGFEAGLPHGCTTVPVIDDPEVTVELHLGQAGAITANLDAADGTPFTGRWYANAAPVDADGRSTGTTVSTAGNGAAMRIGVPAVGRYRLSVSGDSTPAPRIVDLPLGGQADLGTIAFTREQSFNAGATNVVATKPAVVPGDLLEVRAEYTLNTAIAGAVARLAIPTGTTLLPESVLLDDKPAAGSVVAGYFEVPLGDQPAGRHSVLRYTLKVGADAPAGTLPVDVRMHHDGNQDEPLGSTTSQVLGVQLFAAQHSSSSAFAVSGRAPAGAVVTVQTGATQLATATAGPGGLWSAQVTLNPAISGHTYSLTATMPYEGQHLTSNAVSVTYDGDYVRPTSITVGQPDGRDHTFDPALGTARFTLVYVPSQPIRVRADFADTSRLRNVTVQLGDVSAPMTCTPTSCTADVTPDASGVGPVWVDYDVTPIAPATPGDVPAPPSAAQLASLLPGPFAGMTATGATTNPDGSVTGNGTLADGHGTWEATVRSGEGPAFGDTVDYGGLPVSYSHSESAQGDQFTATVKVGVPAEWADQAGPQGRPAGLVHPLGTAGLKRFLEVSYQLYTGADNASNLITQYFKGPESFYNALVDLPYKIDSSCLPDWQKTALKLQVNGAALGGSFLSAANQVIPAAVFALGFFVPVPSLNIVADFALGKFIGYANDAIFALTAREVNVAVDTALADAHCAKPPQRPNPPKNPPTAIPTYIFDPSGYTYEALPSERLPGVSATIQAAAGPDGPWTDWNAADFGQDNPQVTDTQGSYGWDVLPGWWRVKFTKDGYRDAYSAPVQVLPPQTNINVGLQRLAPPVLVGEPTLHDGVIDLTFDTFMVVDSVTGAVTVTDPSGHPVAGILTALDPQTSPEGTTLAKSFRFTPGTPPPTGVYTLRVDTTATDYAHVPLAGAVTRSVTVPGGGGQPSTTTVGVSGNAGVGVAGVLLFAHVTPGTTGGTVTFTDGGTPIPGCTGRPLVFEYAGCVTTFSTPGDHPITATYSGDAANSGSQGAMAVAVSPTPDFFQTLWGLLIQLMHNLGAL